MCWTALSSLNHLTSHHKARWSNCSLQPVMASVRFWRALLLCSYICGTSQGACLQCKRERAGAFCWLLCALEKCSACSYVNFGEPGVQIIELTVPFCVWVAYCTTWGMQCGFRPGFTHHTLFKALVNMHASSPPHSSSITADVQLYSVGQIFSWRSKFVCTTWHGRAICTVWAYSTTCKPHTPL